MIPLEKRFWSRIQKTDGCWLWTGGRNKDGYGKIKVKGAWIAAHRVSWMINKGDIPEGAWVLHRCDNPPCVNPAHLFLGDLQSNMDDCVSKGRRPHGEQHWRSKLSEYDIQLIRAWHPYFTRAGLAALFGVSRGNISDIVNRKYWKHIK